MSLTRCCAHRCLHLSSQSRYQVLDRAPAVREKARSAFPVGQVGAAGITEELFAQLAQRLESGDGYAFRLELSAVSDFRSDTHVVRIEDGSRVFLSLSLAKSSVKIARSGRAESGERCPGMK